MVPKWRTLCGWVFNVTTRHFRWKSVLTGDNVSRVVASGSRGHHPGNGQYGRSHDQSSCPLALSLAPTLRRANRIAERDVVVGRHLTIIRHVVALLNKPEWWIASIVPRIVFWEVRSYNYVYCCVVIECDLTGFNVSGNTLICTVTGTLVCIRGHP